MPVEWEHPQCPHGEDTSDRERWAPCLLAAEWQSPANVEKGKLVKSNVQKMIQTCMLSGHEEAVSWD